MRKTGVLRKKNFFIPALLLTTVILLVLCVPGSDAYQIKRVVRGAASLGSATEVSTLDISGSLGGAGIDLSKAFLITSYRIGNTNDNRIILLIGLIDDPTHLIFSRNVSGQIANIEYMMVEFSSGVNVITGMTTIAELTSSKVITLPTDADGLDLTKSFPLINWRAFRNGANNADENNIFSAELTSPTQLTIRRGEASSNYNNDVGYQVIEFDRDVRVQHGSVTIPASTASATVNLNSAPTYYPVNTAKSFLVFTRMPQSTVNGLEEAFSVDGVITDANTLTFTRPTAGSATTVTLYWYVVEMQNEGFIKTARTSFAAGATTSTVLFTSGDSIDLTRSLGVASVSGGGAGVTADWDDLFFTAQFPNSTNITLTRTGTATQSAANVSWFAAEFPLLDVKTPVGSVSDTDYTGATKWSIAGNGLIEWYYSDAMKTGGLGTAGVHRIKIEISVDGGTTWLQIPGATSLDVDTGTLDNLGSWTWANIPNDIGGTNLLTKYGTDPKSRVKIKISDIETGMGSRIFDISNNYFIINPSLTLNQPPNTWRIGEQKNITWSSTGDLTGKTLTIALAADGTNFDHTVASGVNATTTSYAWTIPSVTSSSKNPIGTVNKLKLTYNDDPLPPHTTIASSSTAFTLKGQIYNVSPTTAETWLLGEQHTVTWSKKGYLDGGIVDGAGTVDLYYSSNGGLSYDPTPIATGVSAGTDAAGGSYNWTLPNNLVTSNPTSKIKVVNSADSSVFGESAAFNVLSSVTVDAPLGGEIWRYGESKTVKWTPHGNLGTVVIKYKIGAGAWNYLPGAGPADNLPGGSPEVQQSFTWLIGNPLGSGQQVTVRVAKNGAEDTVYDDANAPIYLKGTISVSEPHLNELVQVTEPAAGNTKSINWSVNGSISGTAHISLSSDNGASWPIVLTTGTVNITAGTYVWTVAEAHVNVNKVKVSLDGDTDATNGTSGQSPAFKTVNYLKLTYPNATGLTFNVGGIVYIKWTPKPANFGTVDIRYDTNSGLNGYVGVIANAVASNNVPIGETDIGYKWTIPDVAGIVGNKVRIKVFQTGKETEVFSASDYDFTVRGSLTLTGEANGGAYTWYTGENKTITWNVSGDLGTVNIYYSTDGGLNYTNTVATGVAAGSGTGSYIWAIPNNVISTDRNTSIKFKVQTPDGVTSDVSDNALTIQARLVLTQPNGGQVLYVDDPDDGTDNYQISWTTYGQVPQVKLYYDTNSGLGTDGLPSTGDEYLNTIAGGLAITNLDGYSWSVPNAIGNKVRVKVVSAASSNFVYVTSASDFEIKGKIKLITPTAADAGASAWKVHSTDLPRNHLIQWKNCGDLGTVNIYYSDNGGTQYVLVTTATGASGQQNYSWQPPATWGTPTPRNTIGTDNKIKITDASDEANVFAESQAFEIKGQLSITVPGGGEVYYIGGTAIPITWKYAGNLGNIEIFFSSDNGSTWGLALGTIDVAYVQPYNLTVPNQPTTQGKIKLEQVSDRTFVNSPSPSPFAVKGAVNLTAPDGGETWLVSSSHSITWGITGAIANVKLEYSTDAGVSYPNVIIASTPAAAGSYAWTIPDSVGTQIRVKASDAGDATVFDTSTANFNIKPTVTLTAPNGGEVWKVNSLQNITWTKVGTIANVKLEYSTDGGSTYPPGNLIISSTPAAALSYSWTIPDNISNTCVVRISDAGDSSVNDISNAYFKIRGDLTLTSPNGTEAWPINSPQNITWTRVGSIANVKLEYSTNGFSDELQTVLIIASTPADPLPADNAGTYAWTIPDAPSANTKVRVTDVSDSTVFDVSNAVFSIKGTLTITAPNGAEEWVVGAANNITWTKFGNIANVELRYSTDGGLTYPIGNVIIASTPASNLSYTWTIPDNITSQAKVKITDLGDGTVFDESNANFTIKGSVTVTAPNGAETWIVGENRNITWTRSGSFTNVKLEYSTNAFANELQTTVITASTLASALSYAWTVPDAIGTNLKVRITDTANASVADVSNASFIIKGALTLTAPNGAETWIVAESRNITWNRTGSIANVKLEYSTDAGVSYPNVIIASTPAVSGTYAWTIPDAIGNQLRVRVTDAADATVNDTSNANFTVKGSVTLTAPNGGEAWAVGSSQTIAWTKTGSIATVKLEYSTNAFADELQTVVIIASTAADPLPTDNAGDYSWTIPDAISSNVKVRVSNTADTSVNDVSNTTFKIVGSLTLTAPNGGEGWGVGTSREITWTRTGSVANVRLLYSVNGGTSYDYIIVASTPGGTLSYFWTIPDTVTTNAKVKISDAADSTVFDESNAAFKIQGVFTLTAPNGGEVWVVGSSQSISWTNVGTVPNIKLEYSTDGGLTYPNTIVATTPNTNSYAWTIPDVMSTTLKVKVSDVNDATAFDVSNANFKIRGGLTLTAPNGGETWTVGSSRNITWTKSGSIANVKLEYSTDGGTTYPNLIVASMGAALGTYAWTIPDTIGSQVKVRIADTSDGTVSDNSDANFSIKGTLTLTAPNGAEEWVVGTGQNITWTRNGSIANVMLEYSTNGGTTYPNVIVASTLAAPGSYTWTIPDAIGSTLRVRVSDASDATVSDASDANFIIKGALTLNAPNGGEIWTVGESRNITWTRTGSIANVKLEYSTNGGTTYPNLIIGVTPAAAGSYAWTVPDAIGAQLRVNVTDASNATVFDASNGNFTVKGALVLTAPNGAETWLVGTAQNITWNRTGSIANVKLEYSTDAGVTYPNVIIASTPAASGTYAWTIPDSIGTQLRVRVTDASDATVSDVSDANFIIKGRLIIVAPNGAEAWGVNTSQNITWTRYGSIATAKLEYSTNGFLNELQTVTIALSADAATGSYAWTIPDAISSTVKVRITNNADASVYDVSDTNFKIVGVLTLTAPNGAEKWGVNTSQNITWTKAGSISNVKLDYSTNSGVSYPNAIVASTPAGSLSYLWTIPDAVSNQVRVKISDASDSTVFDTSNADFSIIARFDITSPDGGEVWEVDSAHNITWTKIGSTTNAKLEYSTDGGLTYPNLIVASTLNTGSYPWTVPDAISSSVKIKISDAGNADAYDVSASNFKIRGGITVTVPNGGEAWIVGTAYNITWTKVGSIANVKLEYSTDGGTTYPNLIAGLVGAGLGSYSWTIPNNLSPTARVKITDATDASVFDESNANFKIRGALTITAPNGAEVWDVGSVQNITWTRTGSIPTVKLEYSTDGGATYPATIVASTDASTGTYVWTIPDSIGNLTKVRITDTTDSSVNDTSNANFKIRGVLRITAPNGGEVWEVVSARNITWTVTGSIANVKLEYSTDGGTTYPNVIVASTLAGSGTYSWTIPDSITAQGRVRISDVTDATVLDVSDANFKIVGKLTLTAPNGGEVWPVGTVQSITWTKIGSIANARLDYSIDGGVTYPNNIVVSTPASALNYSWTIPDAISSTLKVKITNVDDATVFDTSDANFKIRGNLTLTSPNGTEVWIINTAHAITWTKSGSIANVKLEYSTNGGTTYPNVIAASVIASLGTYNWTIPDNPSVQVRVKVSDAGDATVFDASDANFIIRGGFTLSAPNGGEVWTVGAIQNIAWTTFGSILNVKLEYSSNNGTLWNVIVASVGNTGVYGWTIPDVISTQCLVKVYDVNDPNAMDTSDAVFKIRGSLGLTAPNGGEQWAVGSSQNILWTKVGSIANVKLEYSTDGGATYPNLILATTPAAALTYAWTVPDSISANVKVRISDTGDATVSDASDGVFKIKGGFLLSGPNGGESWIVNSAQNITWLTYGTVNNIKLEYSTDAGTSWSLIIASTVNIGSYAWSVPDAISSTCRVRVSDANDSSALDISDNNFKIRGNLIITAPNGGEKWNVGSSQVVTWTRTGSIANVKLEYSDNGGMTYVIITNSTPNTGSYAWTIPNAITTQARVRITNVDDTTVTDASDVNFKIQGTLNLTSPNGGEAWVVGSVHDLIWTTGGTINFVKLEYSTDGGATYPNLIVSSLGNVGIYSWTVPDNVSGSVRIRVSDASDPEAFDTSNADFRIRTTLGLTSPNGAEVWKVGSVYSITWTKVGTIPSVKLEYSRFNFLSDINLIAAAAPNNGSYAWTIPDSISNTVHVRVSDPNDSGAYDDSNADFRIIVGLTVTSPNGTEMWDVNSVQNITWTSTSAQVNVPQVKLEYSTDGGATYPYIIVATNNTGTYAWTVPDTISASFKVRVSDLADSTAYDVSDVNAKIRAKFTVTAPNGGEIWTVAESRNITWTTVGTVANVKLDYSTNDFVSATQIVASTANSGTYAWTIPNAISTTVKVRVMSTTDSDAFDASNANFKIRGAFVVTAPNGGELWLINQNNAIAWTTTGTIPNVKLMYSTDSGLTYPNAIIASTPNTDSYTWLIPDSPTPNARVRVIDVLDATVYDDSNANFRIRGFFTLTSPNGGESWIVGTSQNITWIKGGTIGYKLSYSTDGGTTYPNVIVTNTNPVQNLGTYAWTVPNAIGLNRRVKIEDPNDNTVYDESDANFTVRGSLTVTVPNGTERWVTNETRAIAWTTPAGTIPNVKLEYSKDNFVSDINTIVASALNTGLYNWTVPNDRSTTVKVRVSDVTNAAVYDISDANFKIDYYNISWELRDLLTNELLTNLSVAEKLYGTEIYNWQAAGLTAPVTNSTPYGYWTTTWTASGYGDKAQNFTADSDQSFVLFMETTAIHIWRAYSEVAYTAATDKLDVTSWLERDGGVVSGAASVSVNIYDAGVLIKTLTSSTPNSAGFFNMAWNATGLQEGKVYAVLTDVMNASGAHFKTPSSFEITQAKKLQATQNAVEDMRDVTLPAFQSSLTNTVTTKLDDQKNLITTKMDEQKQIIVDKTNEMVTSVNTTLTSFETKSSAAITKLQTGADQAVKAGTELEATAKKYSWSVTVSPNPALTGDLLTFNLQGPPGLAPMLDIYNFDNRAIRLDQPMQETQEGLYVYEIVGSKDSFTPGKAFTFIATEQTTSGLVSGSGIVESVSITAIAGLAASAPEAERTAKKVLDAVTALQNVLISDNPVNIGLALTNLQKSVDDLPATMAKEGTSGLASKTLNEVADKLKVLAGDEGIDISSMLEEALISSPTLKDMRGKTDAIQGVIKFLSQLFEAKFGGIDTPIVSTSLAPGSVKFRIAVANPSKIKPQKVPVKIYLPAEVKPKDVMDLGGLNLEYDQEKSIYYVYSNDVELNPLETRLFEVEVEDIWFVPKEEMDGLHKQAEVILSRLKDTDYYDAADALATKIDNRLEAIAKTQGDDSMSREQHIGLYRNNLQTIADIKEDIGKMEKLLVAVGGPPEPSMLKNVKITGETPTKKVTWLVIFIIMIFIGLLAAVFFFTWNSQVRFSENLLSSSKKEAFPERKSYEIEEGEKKEG